MVEKPSDNSDNDGEKESVPETRKLDEKRTSTVEGRRIIPGLVETTGTVFPTPRQIKLREPILNVEKLIKTKEDSSVPSEEKKEDDSRSEVMEVDESPKK